MKIKRKNKKYNILKSHIVIGSLIMLLGVIIFSIKYIGNYYNNQQDSKKLNNFFDKENLSTEIVENNINTKEENQDINNEYIAVLEIPSINLKRGLLDVNHRDNNVEKNITILQGSDMPDVSNGNFILASHSGTGRIAFFSRVNKLIYGDFVYVYYNKMKYIYKIKDKYITEKDGTIEIPENKDISTITLTTCNPNNNYSQLIVVGELTSTEKY